MSRNKTFNPGALGRHLSATATFFVKHPCVVRLIDQQDVLGYMIPQTNPKKPIPICISYTNGIIQFNPDGTRTDPSEQSYRCLGVLAHEILHPIFTPFDVYNARAVKVKYPELYHDICNLVEDYAIETHAFLVFSGQLSSALYHLIDVTYQMEAPIDYNLDPNIPAALCIPEQMTAAMTLVGDRGPVKGEFCCEDAEKLWQQIEPLFQKAGHERYGEKRADYVDAIYRLVEPFVKKVYVQVTKNPAGSGKGRPLPKYNQYEVVGEDPETDENGSSALSNESESEQTSNASSGSGAASKSESKSESKSDSKKSENGDSETDSEQSGNGQSEKESESEDGSEGSDSENGSGNGSEEEYKENAPDGSGSDSENEHEDADDESESESSGSGKSETDGENDEGSGGDSDAEKSQTESEDETEDETEENESNSGENGDESDKDDSDAENSEGSSGDDSENDHGAAEDGSETDSEEESADDGSDGSGDGEGEQSEDFTPGSASETPLGPEEDIDALKAAAMEKVIEKSKEASDDAKQSFEEDLQEAVDKFEAEQLAEKLAAQASGADIPSDSKLAKHKRISARNEIAYESVRSRVFTQSKIFERFLRMAIKGDTGGKRVSEHGSKINVKRLADGKLHTRIMDNYRQPQDVRDMEVSFYIDESGSMSNKVDYVVDTCIAMYEGFEALHIPLSVTGFTSTGADGDQSCVLHHYVTVHHKKEDKFSLAGINAYRNNYDYIAIAEAAADIAKRGAKHKLLIVISDGAPCTLNNMSSNDALAFTKKSIDDARRMGIDVIGVGIHSWRPLDYAAMYGKDFVTVNGDLNQLVVRVSEVIRNVVRRWTE